MKLPFINKNFLIILNALFVMILSLAGLIYFFWPEKFSAPKKLSIKEECVLKGIPRECENLEIWDCHLGHCHTICNEINKSSCAKKECELYRHDSNIKSVDGALEINTKEGNRRIYCPTHLH